MKKWMILLLAITFVFSVVGCTNNNGNAEPEGINNVGSNSSGTEGEAAENNDPTQFSISLRLLII
jgi:hypothetical protein